MERKDTTRPGTGTKPRAAASLTAEVVSRGRHRTQEYGEAGLWRGSRAPSPDDGPVRMVLPPRTRRSERPTDPDAEARSRSGSPLEPKPVNELVPLLLFSAAVFIAVFLVGLLFF